MACINLPVFPIQLLLRQNPDWSGRPVAVVDFDKPQGTILWINEHARVRRIRPGMRYAAGLSLAGDLHAAVVSDKEIDEAVSLVCNLLGSYSPDIEPSPDDAGVFWLNASGLERLYGSLNRWAQSIRTNLQHIGFYATIVLGFRRFATYALAKAHRNIVIFQSPAKEQKAAQDVRLELLAFDNQTLDLLLKLGIQTVGQFITLPPTGIAERFGPKAHRLHQLARGILDIPLVPLRPPEPFSEQIVLDYPEKNVDRLTAVIQQLLVPILKVLGKRGRLVCELKIRFQFDRIGSHAERLKPANPTREASLLLELIRLRLQISRSLPDGVVEIQLTARSVTATPRQEHLLDVRPRRDMDAANRALARVRAEFGNKAVVRARLREAHLPEGQFTWEPLHTLKPAKPRMIHARYLIRRIRSRPKVLPVGTQFRHEPEVWLRPNLPRDTIVHSCGPYVVSGGWWQGSVQRAYHYVETRTGEILWIYYDRLRRRWFQQGQVE
jgi:protein ImuB